MQGVLTGARAYFCNKILRNASGNHFIPFDRTNFTNACRLAASLELVRNK